MQLGYLDGVSMNSVMDGSVKSEEGQAICAGSLNGDGEKTNGSYDENNGEFFQWLAQCLFVPLCFRL